MADVKPFPVAASIVSGPSTSGFIRGGRKVDWDLDVWRDSVKFDGGPCDAPFSYPNKDAACADDTLVDPDLVTDADPKAEHQIATEGPFFPWTVVENIVCHTSDVARERHLELARVRIEQIHSSMFAQEISGGGYSGSPSFQSSAVPISTTAYDLVEGMQRLLDARITAGAPGPHVFHMPSALEPLASSLTLTSTDDYRIVFDNYVKAYVPTEDTADGAAPAVIPTSAQAWIAITGPYEYTFDAVEVGSARALDARRINKMFIQAEQKLFFRYETCNTFLAKVTVFN